MEKPILKVISQGCAANFGEGEKIARLFENKFQVVFGLPDKNATANASEVHTYILNVCTVKGNASAIKLLKQAKEATPEARIIVTGCAPKDLREEASRLFENIGFSSLKELAREQGIELGEEQGGKPATVNATSQALPEVLRESPLVGIVNIEEGCLDVCAYCSTRLVKGRLHSYPAASIVQQVRQLVADGCREIQLTGQDCGCYGFDFADVNHSGTPRNLAELVQRILVEVPGDYRIRLGMGNPRHMLQYKDALLECFQDDRVYKFIHLPVQSGSPRILQAMNRKHSAQDYADLAREFTQRFPLFTLSTDLIVGFPGETDEDFNHTLRILRESRPTVCNITRFVPRPGTVAARMEADINLAVPDAIKHKRSAELAAAFQQIAVENNRRWINQVEIVTVEKNGYRKGTLIARNDAYRPVAIAADSLATEVQIRPGTRLKVRITDAEPFALIGEPM